MDSFKKEALDTHNAYRKIHGAPALKWSNKLYQNAQRWADQLARRGSLQHESQNKEGENLACMQGQELTGKKATEMWYNEIKHYSYKNARHTPNTGHFTQVVWVGSTELGIARSTASNGMQFVVARYNPPGNMMGRYQQNVLPPNSKPTTRPSSTAPTPSQGINKNNNNNNNQASRYAHTPTQLSGNFEQNLRITPTLNEPTTVRINYTTTNINTTKKPGSSHSNSRIATTTTTSYSKKSTTPLPAAITTTISHGKKPTTLSTATMTTTTSYSKRSTTSGTETKTMKTSYTKKSTTSESTNVTRITAQQGKQFVYNISTTTTKK